MHRTFFALALVGLVGCGNGSNAHPDATVHSDVTTHDALTTDSTDASAPAPVQVMMDFTRSTGFYTAPFPSEDLRTAAGGVDMSAFPNPNHNTLISQCLAMITADGDGFPETVSSYFELTGAPDATRLTDVHGSLLPSANVFIMDVDPNSPDVGQRQAVDAHYEDDGGPFGAPHLLSVLPYQGKPLRPLTLYATVVLRSLQDPQGNPLAVSPTMMSMAAGVPPPGMSPTVWTSYQTALAHLATAGISVNDIAGLGVFRTRDPAAVLSTVLNDALSHPLPNVNAPWTAHEVFPTYCVYQSTIPMPDYQNGTPPFTSSGGGWLFDSSGHPIVQRQELATIYVTVPRTVMPTGGFPTVVFIETGAGGGPRGLVDRGVQAVNGGPPIVPGSGPALQFAQAGFAGVSFDGPFEGIRNPMNLNEDATIVNVANPSALRDNFRETAMEHALFAHALDNITLDASSCPGFVASGPMRFDTTRLAIFGHSLGASVEPLTLAAEPRYGAGILAGAGGSWIANVLYKLSPVALAPVMEVLFGYSGINRPLLESDPALSILQWAGEPADPPVYDRTILQEPGMEHPRDIYMVQGIVDTYILPAISNATSLSLGLDLAGMELDDTTSQLSMFTPIGTLLDLSGRSQIGLPAMDNITAGGSTVTALFVQDPGDGLEDPHEVIFQTAAPKYQYECFLQDFAAGLVPTVPATTNLTAPCH